jgi:hypothetical protein
LEGLGMEKVGNYILWPIVIHFGQLVHCMAIL